MSPRLDLDLTEAQDFGELPEGPYEVELTSVAEPKQGPNSTYVSVEFTITEGEFAGRKLWRNYPITGKGAGFFIDLWEKATGEKLEIGDMAQVDSDELLGAELTAVNGHREYEGQIQNEVKRILAR